MRKIVGHLGAYSHSVEVVSEICWSLSWLHVKLQNIFHPG